MEIQIFWNIATSRLVKRYRLFQKKVEIDILFPVATAWRVLRLRMEERPPGMEGSCEYIE
jgi:hypothetical protein